MCPEERSQPLVSGGRLTLLLTADVSNERDHAARLCATLRRDPLVNVVKTREELHGQEAAAILVSRVDELTAFAKGGPKDSGEAALVLLLADSEDPLDPVALDADLVIGINNVAVADELRCLADGLGADSPKTCGLTVGDPATPDDGVVRNSVVEICAPAEDLAVQELADALSGAKRAMDKVDAEGRSDGGLHLSVAASLRQQVREFVQDERGHYSVTVSSLEDRMRELSSSPPATAIFIGQGSGQTDVLLQYLQLGIPVLIPRGSRSAALLRKVVGDNSFESFVWPDGERDRVEVFASAVERALADAEGQNERARAIKAGLRTVASTDAASRTAIDAMVQVAREKALEGGSPSRHPGAPAILESPLTMLEESGEAFLRLGIEQYEAGRKAADSGSWVDSFDRHSNALVCFKQVGNSFWEARVAGRLAWILIAQHREREAHSLLRYGAERDALQGAANYLWSAQYAMRAYNIPAATEMLEHFINRLSAIPRAVPQRTRLERSREDAVEELMGCLKILYREIVSQAEDEGFGSICGSDRGRLHVLNAATTNTSTTERELGMAAVCFRSAGLSSYARFCDGRRQLLLACADSQMPGSPIVNIEQATEALRGVTQRFPGDRDVVNNLLRAARAHRLVVEIVEGGTGQGTPAERFLQEVEELLVGDPDVFGAEFVEAAVDVVSEVRRVTSPGLSKSAPPESQAMAWVASPFARLYDTIPTVDVFYSRRFQDLLLAAARKGAPEDF